MSSLSVTLACGPYDRTRGLADGRVAVEGVDLTYLCLEPEEIFFRMTQHAEFDAAELSLSSFLIMHATGRSPFVAIPVFPSRMFRHSSVYVRESTGITSPSQLAGRRVGLAEYQLTANVWVRGIFEDHYDLEATDVSYRTGGLNEPGRKEKLALAHLPPDLDLEPIATDRTLSDMLVTGEIDAIYSPRAPDAFVQGRPEVRRLFADPRTEEADYYRRTGIFPIMHVVVVRRDLYDANRWLARSLTKAFQHSKALALRELARSVALSVTLPWSLNELDATTELMGQDFWPYGLEPNRGALELFVRYSHSQGLIPAVPSVSSLFAPETLDHVVI